VSGTELRDGNSWGLSSVWTWSPPFWLETVDESSTCQKEVWEAWETRAGDSWLEHSRLLWERDQWPESRTSRPSD
jgi:hypothetical protein